MRNPGSCPRTPAHTHGAGEGFRLVRLRGASLETRSDGCGTAGGGSLTSVRLSPHLGSTFPGAPGGRIPGRLPLSAGPCKVPRSRPGRFRSLRSGGVLVGQPGVRMIRAGTGGREPAYCSQREPFSGPMCLRSWNSAPPPRTGSVARAHTANQGKFEAQS